MEINFKVYTSEELNNFLKPSYYMLRNNVGEYEGFINDELVFATGFASDIHQVPMLKIDSRKFVESVTLVVDMVDQKCDCECHRQPGVRHIVACCRPQPKIRVKELEIEAFKSPKKIVVDATVRYQ